MGVHDLNCVFSIYDPIGLNRVEVMNECWQDAVRTSHGLCAVEDLWPNRPAPQRRCGHSNAQLRRFVSRDGVFAAHVARVAVIVKPGCVFSS